MNPYFEMKPFSFGYSLTQPREAVQAAFELAEHIVADMEREGWKTRDWGITIHQKIDDLISSVTGDVNSGHPLTTGFKKSLLDSILGFEEDIKESVRSYFGTISENLARMKKLNPPLTNSEIDPFLRKINESRKMTIDALDLLRLDLEKLNLFKSRIFTFSAH
jgi:hypothetical protein